MIDYNLSVKKAFDSIKRKDTIEKVANILNTNSNFIVENSIKDDIEIKHNGMFINGKILIGISEIERVLHNYLNEMDNHKKEIFLKLFIEAILVHELHHCYMYEREKERYFYLKERDKDKKYIGKELEKSADEFMVNYMENCYDALGEKVGQLSKVFRETINSEYKKACVCGIINEIMELSKS